MLIHRRAIDEAMEYGYTLPDFADFVTLFKEIPTIDAGLAASIFHFGEVDIKELKKKLKSENINVRI